MTMLLVVLMTAVAEWTGEREVLFPEITALAVGAWLAPRQVWKVDRPRLVGLIALCSVGGVLIVKTCPLPLGLQLAIAFGLSQFILLFSGTSFAPLTSAMVLPVLLGTDTWAYPVSAVVMTLLIAVGQFLLEKRGLREPVDFAPAKPDLRGSLCRPSAFYGRILVAVALLLFAAATPWRFCAAPPLLVAFVELTNPACPARARPLRTVLLVALCTLAGSLSRYLLCLVWGLPLTAAAVAASLFLLALVYGTKFYFPPAGAMAVLPLLVPETAVATLPAQVLAGLTLLMLAARLLFREKAPEADAKSPA